MPWCREEYKDINAVSESKVTVELQESEANAFVSISGSSNIANRNDRINPLNSVEMNLAHCGNRKGYVHG